MNSPTTTSVHRSRLPWSVAALVGMLAVGVALAIGDLIAALINPDSSPLLAVGSRAIDLTPGFVKEFAVQTFGDTDKIVLVGGMGLVILLVAVLSGLISRARPHPGVIAAVLIGALGVLAVLSGPVFSLPVLVAPLVSLITGAAVFALLHGKARQNAGRITVADRLVLLFGALGVFLVVIVKSLVGQPNMSAGLARNLIIAGFVLAGLSLVYTVVRVVRGGGERVDTVATGQSTSEPAGLEPVEGDAAPAVTGRRPFLVASAGAATSAAVLGFGGYALSGSSGVEQSRRAVGAIRPVVKAPPIPAGAAFVRDGTPSFITPNNKFYRVDTLLRVPQIRAEDWSLRIHGMVERELTFDFNDIRGRNLVERTITMTCVSNEVGGRYVSTANFVGVPMRELLMEAGVRESSDQLFSTSYDGYTAGTPVDVLMDAERGAMLAIAMNDEPLPAEHGFPVRMVTPGLYGYLSATKWVVDMELTTFDAKQAYWVPRGYAMKAPIKTQSRIDKPKAFEEVPSGKTTVAGIAWGQPNGVKKVQVRIDDGKWEDAELATEVNGSTWRMWRADVDVPDTGIHSVECRATDGTGYTQTDKDAAPLPSGATGWHSVSFLTS